MTRPIEKDYVTHITRVRCPCGETVEVQSYAECHQTRGWSPRCHPEVAYDFPKGWLAHANVPMCPTCVAKKYGSFNA